MYKGVIIEESLKDLSVLEKVRIVGTEVESVTEEHGTPTLDRWTLHRIEIPPENAESVAEQLSSDLRSDDETGKWYADFGDGKIWYIVFSGKVFKVERGAPEQIDEVIAYGLEQGIPEQQLDFSWDKKNDD